MILNMVALLIASLAIAGASLAGAAGTWEVLSPISAAPRQEHSVVSLSDTMIAIVGGIVPNVNGTQFETTSILQLYNIPRDIWYSATNVPTNVNHPNVAVVNGKIYLLGGLGVASDGSWRAFPDCWVYDPYSDTWVTIDPMPSGQERQRSHRCLRKYSLSGRRYADTRTHRPWRRARHR